MSELENLRKKIDEIDVKILSLLKKRMEVVHQVGEYKKKNREKFFIRSNREADMIKSILGNAKDINVPPSAILSIWRKIITSANIYEQDLRIGIWNPRQDPSLEYIVKDYYLNDININSFDQLSALLSALDSGEVNIVALPCPMEENVKWWKEILKTKSDLKIYAKLPFFQVNDQELFIGAKKKMEKSSRDKTLLVVDFIAKEIPNISDAMSNLGYGDIKILDQFISGDLTSSLIELPVFIDDQERMTSKVKSLNIGANIIGCYSFDNYTKSNL